MKKLLIGLVGAIALTAPALAQEDPVARGNAIAEEWDRRDEGFQDSVATLKMVLENRQGETSERSMRIETLETPGTEDGDKTLVVFDYPRDVKGTAFLSFAHILEPDDQWLYLPALKRVKRISSKNKSGPFVGSEFAYEDISSQELKKYTYKFLRQEPCGEWDCFVLEQTPIYEKSGYTKMVVWYDTEEYRQVKIDYYDRKEELLKTLEFSKFEQYLGKYWRALDMYMVNHQTGKKTRLVFENFAFQTGLSERDFNKNRLARAK